MRITHLTIKNYKSIKSLTISLERYGTGGESSSTMIFVGMNESGKSSILEAINYLHTGFKDVDFDDIFHKGSEEGENVSVEAHIEVTNQEYYQNRIINEFKLDESYKKHIKIEHIKRRSYINEKTHNISTVLSINSSFPFHEFVIVDDQIKNLKDINEISEDILPDKAKKFLKDGQKLLTKTDFESLIRKKIGLTLLFSIPKIQLWKATPEFLITEPIDLEEFKAKPEISIPLQHIFNMNGFDTTEKIKLAIEKSFKKAEYKAELQEKLSQTITKYVNTIWKEHKISVKVHIDGSYCTLYIEDNDKQYKYFNTKQRSEGFNQFLSMILSLSAKHESKKLRNFLILLDEPETHLHPSGVRYMRDEILRIGKNNNVIVSTHSPYMVDIGTPERHFIVVKKEMTTKIEQVDKNTSITDDEVLAAAFGINIFKELLPKNIIVVEGHDDKIILLHILNIFHKNFFCSIKSAGGASKVYSTATILADEKINAHFLLDDDHEGIKNKNQILKNLKENYNKDRVFTVRDLINSQEGSTLEDLYPIQFVKTFFDNEMKMEFNFKGKLPIIIQIKNQCESLKENKDQLDSKKFKLAQKFIDSYKEKSEIEKDAPLLVELVSKIVTGIQGE